MTHLHILPTEGVLHFLILLPIAQLQKTPFILKEVYSQILIIIKNIYYLD